MISQDRLRILARELGVRQGYAEKNYVNSWLLWGIFTSDYGDNLLFKGGTALSKLYFPQSWRFSEDLDFGVEGEYQGSKQELRAVLDTIADRSGIEFEIREHHESQQDHYPTHYVDISIQYRAVLNHPNTTSIDVLPVSGDIFSDVSRSLASPSANGTSSLRRQSLPRSTANGCPSRIKAVIRTRPSMLS
jgi:predicted nucleotidyltransferase component of viral defense system